MLKIDDLKTETCIDGKWVKARPLRGYGIGFFWNRIKDAWQVVIGQADAVTFYKQ